MKFKAIIFDMDGVLVNSEPYYIKIEKENFKLLGLEISAEEHQTYQGTATDYMWTVLKKKYKISKSINELVVMTNQMTYPWFESLETIETMPGVEKLLQFLKNKDFPLAVASSSYPDVIDIILDKTGIKLYFDVIVNSTMVRKSKPAPDIFLHTSEKLNVRPEDCLVIEDSTNGIKAAKDAGMYCIAFAGPGSEFQDQNGADKIIQDYKELISVITG